MASHIVVFQKDPNVVRRLRKLRMFRGVRIVAPGRLLSRQEYEERLAKERAEQRRAVKSLSILQHLAQEVGHMTKMVDNFELAETAKRFRARRIMNHKPLRRSMYSTVRLAVLVFAVLCFCSVTRADDLPDAPTAKFAMVGRPKPVIRTAPFNRKVYVAGVISLAASKTADAIVTRSLLNRGGKEFNPIFGTHPSPAKQAGINLAFFIAQSGIFYVTERNHRPWVRWAGRVWIAGTVVNHAQLAACGTGIDPHGHDRCNHIPSVW